MSQLGFSTLSYEGIEGISGELKTKAGNMNDLLNEIKSLFEKIGQDGIWAGDAADDALAKFNTLSAKFPGFYNAVMDCSKYLDNMLSDYRAADAEIQNLEIKYEE